LTCATTNRPIRASPARVGRVPWRAVRAEPRGGNFAAGDLVAVAAGIASSRGIGPRLTEPDGCRGPNGRRPQARDRLPRRSRVRRNPALWTGAPARRPEGEGMLAVPASVFRVAADDGASWSGSVAGRVCHAIGGGAALARGCLGRVKTLLARALGRGWWGPGRAARAPARLACGGEPRPACPGGVLGSVSDRGVEGEGPLADGGGSCDGHRAVGGDGEGFGGG
jgi:hypothetical protein